MICHCYNNILHFYSTLSFCIKIKASPYVCPRRVCTRQYNNFCFRFWVAVWNAVYSITYFRSASHPEIDCSCLSLSAAERKALYINFFFPLVYSSTWVWIIPISYQADTELLDQYSAGLFTTNLANCPRTKPLLVLHAFLLLCISNLNLPLEYVINSTYFYTSNSERLI